ncbi:MAG TPA: hypothetical protein H9763_00885 [Candidatus Eisenbergiella merdigallinarum]|uniref:Uncharacterized protein n=1 Tax=Candidatus Eisenbergiella merdigallinarum TaxID=2838552 RepID=A0A9D2SCI1_9FIRM|nr:hypothetical protein [Candidatus Eisenbergiella merdigallinarum]
MENYSLQLFAEPELPKNTITPEINYETVALINTTPEAEQPTWASMAAVMKNMTQALNEVLYQASYYEDQGWGSTEVTGAQLTLTVTGDVKPGDAASEYLTSEKVQFGLANARKTHLKLVRGTKVVIWPVTLANITVGYGDSNQPNSLSLTIHGNGRPSVGTTEAAG